ncbi:MAG: proline--tRNA ligase [Anaerolineae bacterium]
MRLSRAFFQTLRDAPGDAELTSHQLLLRAGFIQPLGAGIYSYLPLARRSMDKIEGIIRAEMNAIGGQEVTMPVAHPADLWQQTGRWHTAYPELVHWKDRAGREMTLAMTHEEVVADLARREISSYRQLPQMIYHLQTKFRDEPRPRGGLIRVREFTMKDSYSLDVDEAGLDRQYRAHWQAYFNIFRRCGLDVHAVRADVGMMGGSLSHEYMALTDAGEDTLLLCAACGYAANRQVARVRKPQPAAEALLPVTKVATPDCKSIAELAAFLNVPTSRTAKAVFLRDTGSGRIIFAVVRGDMDVNETKLANVVGASGLQPASEEEIHAIGAQPGYGSPVGVHDCVVVVDDLAAASPNLVAGANEAGYHLLNVTCGRDYTPDIVADIVAARAGDACEACGAALQMARGIEVGNIFKLGTRYAEALGALYTDAEGNKRPIVMGSYGIGVGRLLATVAELSHDAAGLIWPVSIAPFQVHLVVLPKKAPDAARVADALYAELIAAGIEVLYDDREDPSAGVKFNDADLIGLPLRVTVGAKALQEGGVELKRRSATEKQLVALDALLPTVQIELAELRAELAARVQTVPFMG